MRASRPLTIIHSVVTISSPEHRSEPVVGMFAARIGVSNGNGGTPTYVDATVDTGAVYTVLPANMLRQAGIEPYGNETFEIADGTRVELPVGEARITIGEKGRTSPVVFGDSGRYLLGAITLQTLGLIPDTTNHRLIPDPLFL